MGGGYNAIVVNEAKEAAFKIGNDKFDFIIFDLSGPELKLKNDEIVELLIEKNKKEQTILILTTQSPEAKLVNKLKDLPRVFFSPKPISIKDLIKKLRDVLSELSAPPVINKKKPEPQKASSSFDVRVVNPLIAAALTTISSVFGGRLIVGKPYLRKGPEVSGDISGLIGLASENFKGNVALSFPSASYLKVISNKMGVDMTELNEEARDAIAEIIKLITDQAKLQFEKDSLSVIMTSPTVVTGNAHSLVHQSTTAPVVIVFRNDEGEGFRIEISTQK